MQVTGDAIPTLIQHIDVHVPRVVSAKHALESDADGSSARLVDNNMHAKPANRLQAGN